ncbi:hypothetical protein KHS38_04230 [Mucilaginibacter sp. Bleaf8]|uniref:hypothetical protein n=1 Tax=Mucilaginibacter sp. Bleaf8 TaxID=2834430 RepID=UPI001BCD0E71|nr:hypothetical protein [Mucilaginibacter sp. Bleaf8]MBS7563605.1 hypothetical protein [Mucilaginibacter sp. Bleaf8]
MKAIIITLILTACTLAGFCQKTSGIGPLLDDINLMSLKMIKEYHPNRDSVDNSCQEFCVFIKFNISAKGKLTNIAYTRTTPAFVQQALTKAFKAIEPAVKIRITSQLAKRTYILPLQLIHNEGCGLQYGSWPSPEDEKLTEEMKQVYKDRQLRFSHSPVSIWNITHFTDGNRTDAIDCILLSPLRSGGIIF